MEISINNVEFNDDSWKNLPSQRSWKETYTKAKFFLMSKLLNDQATSVLDKIDKMIEILVRNGDTYENMVLEIAVVYSILTNTNYKLEDLSFSVNKNIENAVQTLVQAGEQNNLNLIFENKEMPYLNKIKLSEYILNLKQPTSVSARFKTLVEAKKIVETFSGKTHKGLMKMLIEACNN